MKKNKNFGIGIDIENIQRFRELDYAKYKAFLNKIFTKNELDYCFSKKESATHLTARFVAKEAIYKALSVFNKGPLDYTRIEIANSEKGAPSARFKGTNFRNLRAYLSLSHCDDKAVALAIVTEKGR